jgi:hypothetical protein
VFFFISLRNFFSASPLLDPLQVVCFAQYQISATVACGQYCLKAEEKVLKEIYIFSQIFKFSTPVRASEK